jgi:hypothetical protein
MVIKEVKGSRSTRYFEVEKDNSYVQEEPDMAEAIYIYYVRNPNGDSDGSVEVSKFSDGTYQIEDVEDTFSAPEGELYAMIVRESHNETFGIDKAYLESILNNVFKEYVEEYLSGSRN